MFPAHAGMNRSVPMVQSSLDGVPRPRGDEPELLPAFMTFAHVFPAHAGMNRCNRV